MELPTKRLRRSKEYIERYLTEQGIEHEFEFVEDEGYLVALRTPIGAGLFSDYNQSEICYYCYDNGSFNRLEKEGYTEEEIFSNHSILLKLDEKNFAKFLAGKKFRRFECN